MMSKVITLMHDQLIDKLILKGFVMYDFYRKTEELLRIMRLGPEDDPSARSICAESMERNKHIIKAAQKKGVELIVRFYSFGTINKEFAVLYEEKPNSAGWFRKP